MDSRYTNLNYLLDVLLAWYEEEYQSDSLKLRLSISEKEMWRFFIDGLDQKETRVLNLEKHLRLTLGKKLPKDFTNRTVAEIKEIYPALPSYLKERDWDLSEAQASQYTIADLININRAWIAYEQDEPGYLEAMVKAFDAIFDPKAEFNVQFILMLHTLATQHVKLESYAKKKNIHSSVKGEFRGSHESVSFSLNSSNASQEGISEFLKRDEKDMQLILRVNQTHVIINDKLLSDLAIKKYSEDTMRAYQAIPEIKSILNALSEHKNLEDAYKIIYKIICSGSNNFELYSRNPIKDGLYPKIESRIKKYHDAIKEIGITPMKKLESIVTLIQSLEQLHPFSDGNCRTFCMLLLNFLLKQEGFPLVILKDPNAFDMNSIHQLLILLTDGMMNTFHLANKRSIFNIQTDTVLKYLEKRPGLRDKSIYFSECIAIEKNNRKKYSTIKEAKISDVTLFKQQIDVSVASTSYDCCSIS